MTRRINGDALENRSGAAATGNVFTFDDAHVDGGVWQAPGAGSASAAWPIGSVYENVLDATNPATLLGFGTWVALGAGRVLVGFDVTDVDFDTVGETGGAKTKAISAHAGTAVGDHTAHGHGYGTIATVAESSHTHAVGTIATVAESSHTHAVGTIAVGDHTGASMSHLHNIRTGEVGGLATISAHAQHRHQMQQVFAHDHPITDPTHYHAINGAGSAAGALVGSTPDASTSASVLFGYNTGLKATGITVNTNGNNPAYTDYETQGTHTLGGTTEGNGPATLTHSIGGSTAAGSSHSHGVSGSTAAGSSHSHGVSGSTSSDALSAHSVTQPSAHADLNVLQPYIVVHRWYRSA